MAIPALMSKKLGNAPVMMRITREEEHYIGRARAGIQGRAKIGFRKDGKILAMDFFTLQDNGPYNPQGDYRSAGSMASLNFQPEAYRWRGISVLTNTPPRTSQRSPGGMQMNAILDPIMAQAAKRLGVDHVELLKINAPVGKAPYGPIVPATKKQAYVTQANVREALDQGAALFGWAEKKAVSGQKRGTKVRGIGVAVGPYTAGSIGFDGLAIVRPDGKVQVQSGIGNLGTESVFDCQRVYAEVLDTPWEQFEVVWGNTDKGLPWSCVSAGSQTVHAMTRAAHAGATALKANLQEVAARALGGNAAGYQVANGRVFGGGRSLTFADAAKKAIELGGKFDGHEGPEDINAFTKASLQSSPARASSASPRTTTSATATPTRSSPASPRSKSTSRPAPGASSTTPRWATSAPSCTRATSPGRPSAARCSASATPCRRSGSTTSSTAWRWRGGSTTTSRRASWTSRRPIKIDATDIPDPETPVGARGIGEPPVGAGCGAVAAALVNALGAEAFRRYADHARPAPDVDRSEDLAARRAHGAHLREHRIMAVIHDMMPAFELFQPSSLDDALALLDRHGGDALVMAGGLDSFDWLKDRIRKPRYVVDLGGIEGLRGVKADGRRHRDRRDDHPHRGGAHPLVREKFGVLLAGRRSGGLAADPQPGHASAAT